MPGKGLPLPFTWDPGVQHALVWRDIYCLYKATWREMAFSELAALSLLFQS